MKKRYAMPQRLDPPSCGPFMQAVAHAAVETHLNVPEGLTLQGLAKGASMALTACQRWDIPFHGHS